MVIDFLPRNRTVGKMNRGLVLTILAYLALSSVLHAELDHERADDLIAQLGSESYPLREAAGNELWALGGQVVPSLEKAATGLNPEIVSRSRALLRKLKLGILPDSEPEIVALVLSYDGAKPNQRRIIIEKLKKRKAWRQALRLHELETDPTTLAMLESEMEGVAIFAARELLAADPPNPQKALDFLKLGRSSLAQLISIAEFHRAQGTLANFQSEVDQLPVEQRNLSLYAINAISKRFAKAAAAANAADRPELAARMQLLQGDPVPWLNLAKVPESDVAPKALTAYRNAVTGLWSGRRPPAKTVRSLVDSINGPFDEESWHSLRILFALGEVKKGEKVVRELSPTMAFNYFDTIEKTELALEAFGLDPENPRYTDWVDERFKKVLTDHDQAVGELSELSQLGSFLENRGESELLTELFVPPLEKLAAKDPESFLVVASDLFSNYPTGAVIEPILKACATYAGDDLARWDAVLDTLFIEGIHVRALWESIPLYKPELDGFGRLKVLATVLGVMPDNAGAASNWWEWAFRDVAGSPADAKPEKFGLLLTLCMQNPNGERFVNLTELIRKSDLELTKLGRFSDEYRFAGYEILSRAAMGQWNVLVRSWKTRVENRPTDPVATAYLAGALRRDGQVDEADQADRTVELLALGDVRAVIRIGQAYATVGDFKRAADWWFRAAINSGEKEGWFHEAAKLLVSEAKEQGDWKLAAALGEIRLLYEVMSGGNPDDPAQILRWRIEVEMGRALSRLATDRAGSLATLERCHQSAGSDGSMADYFFPALRQAGLTEEHDRWFQEAWQSYQKVLERYPKSHNTMNTAAWTAARANRMLDEAEALVRQSLVLRPDQPAYLDTLGEVFFCRQDRENALEYSGRAVSRVVGTAGMPGLLRQYERFRIGAFPVE